jgi:outer membrane protein, heavy metal efflux system
LNRFLLLTGLIALGGCQRYTARPLNLEAHRAAWAERSAAGDDVTAFARELVGSGRQPEAYDPSDGISLAEAEVIALFFNPELRLARERAKLAKATAENAGLWEDPVLSVDALHVVESVAEPWILATSLTFTVPVSGRLEKERSKADAEQRLALQSVAAQEWALVIRLRSAWLFWSAMKLRASLTAEVLRQLDSLADITGRLETAGEIPRLESRLFRIERASQSSSLLSLQAQVEELELGVKALMGLVPNAPLDLHPSVVISTPEGTPDERPLLLETMNPTLAAHRAAYEVAEQALQLELRRQYPDLGIGPAYGNEDGNSRVGLGLVLPIPLLNRNRRGIAEALAQRDLRRVTFEAEYEQLVGDLARAELRLEYAQKIRAELETSLVPLVDEQVQDAQRLAKLGELNTLLQLESLVRAQEAKLKLIDARLAEADAANGVRALLGPEASRQESETPQGDNP